MDNTNLDLALKTLDDYIKANTKACYAKIIILTIFTIIILGFGGFAYNGYIKQYDSFISFGRIFGNSLETGEVDKDKLARILTYNKFHSETQLYTLYGIFIIYIITFSVTMSLYRFDINEIAKAHHYKIGFLRIGLALNSSNEIPSELSKSIETLTENAFNYNLKTKNKIESPLQGYPTSDISTSVLNKIIGFFKTKKI